MEKEEQSKKIGQIVAKAWNDVTFKERLLKDTNNVLKEEGMEIPDNVEIRAVENTNTLVHFIVPAKPNEVNKPSLELKRNNILSCHCWQGEAWH
ncbi:MAG: NHLP leader peptide family RiPP precursor [Candidatus Thorarchaeota archaeon]